VAVRPASRNAERHKPRQKRAEATGRGAHSWAARPVAAADVAWIELVATRGIAAQVSLDSS